MSVISVFGKNTTDLSQPELYNEFYPGLSYGILSQKTITTATEKEKEEEKEKERPNFRPGKYSGIIGNAFLIITSYPTET